MNHGIVSVASMLVLGNHGAMWPFKKPKSMADMAIAIMPYEIENARVKWTEFYGFMKWKEHVGLATKIHAFLQPFELGLYERHPFLKEGKIMGLLIVTQGIMLSGTHTQQELEEAVGCKLPGLS